MTHHVPQLLSAAEVTLREAVTLDDAESMRVSRNECAGALTRSAMHLSPEDQAQWWATLERSHLTPYVVTHRGKDVGYAIKRQEHGAWWLTAGLRVPFRGYGLGYTVFRKLIDACGDTLPVRLEVLVTNVAALKLYRKLGFQVIGYTERQGAEDYFTMQLSRRPPLVSVVFGTYNRRELLTRFMRSLEDHLRDHPYEFVICDGGSTDGTRQMLAEHDKVLLVGERSLEGAVKAFNQCYALSRGEYVAVLNDDLITLDRGLDEAVSILEARADVGQVALGFKRGNHNAVISGSLPNHIYANLGVIRRDVANRVAYITGGMWPVAYHTYGADTELSCWVERMGLAVHPIRRNCFHDLIAADALRAHNAKSKVASRDNRTFWGRWPDVKCLSVQGLPPCLTDRETTRRLEVEAA